MCYSIELKDRVYVNVYGFLSFTKNMSNRYSQKLLNSAKKSATDAIKTASKTAIQKTTEATGDLIGNKIADKITCAPKKLHSKADENEIEIPKERYILYLQKKGSKLLMI